MGNLKQKTILLVEDEALIAVMEQQTLIKHGFNVITASNGEKAIEVVNTNPNIDLILMDINLGKGMDGTETAEIILKEKDIPVLFLSSHIEPEVVQKTEKISSYGYVTKDSGETVLMASIKMAFKLYKAYLGVEQIAEQFRSVISASIDGFWLVDLDGRIKNVNEAYCVMSGYDRDTLLTMSFADLDVSGNTETSRDHINEVIKNGSDLFESQHRCKDGRIIDVEVSVTYVRNHKQLVVFLHEITERKQMEDLLRVAEERFRTLATLAPVGIYLTDPDGNCLYANPAWCKMAGLRLEEALGQGWVRGLHPDDRAFIVARWQQMVESQGQWELEYRFQSREGVIRNVYGLAAPQYNASGKIIRYVGVNLNITERKQAEEELLKVEQRYQMLIENARDGIFSLNPEGLFLYVNRELCDMLGYEHEELLRLSILDTYPDDMREDGGRRMAELRRGEALRIERPMKRKNGSFIMIAASAWKTEEGYLQAIVRDITEHKLAEHKINSLLAEKELLLREVHHRIKNHMNVIIGLLSLQSNTMVDNPSAVAALEDSKSRVQSMMVLYDKLYQSGDFRAISTKEYLTSLIDEIVGNFTKRQLITIEKEIDNISLGAKTLSPVGMILNELLTNMMKYAFVGRQDGLIGVSFSAKDNLATLIVQDNGIGIPESFDIGVSSGFGMQLVSLLTKQIDGVIRLERESGTKFIVEFEV